MKPLRAMIVDDNATDRAYIRAVLNYITDGKLEVDETDSASGAIALFQPKRYDVVVADYHLFGQETGYDVLSRVKRIDPDCRRVMVTGDSRKQLAKDVKRDDVAESVVLKTSGPALLREALSPVLPN